ncbi:MAG TPA: NAD-dependent epimerase/dehydratase family protein [Chloroflexota bacterium]
MKARRILVTGGAGFIGCNLVDALASRGDSVTIFDNLSRRGSEANLAWINQHYGANVTMVHGDCRDSEALLDVARGQQVIYHCAAQTAVTTSVVDPRGDLEANLLGTFNALEAAREAGDDPVFVYTSTNKVYGALPHLTVTERNGRYEFRDIPEGVSEKEPLDFHSPYGCSKGAADQYVRDYSRIYGLRTVVFRQSCIYGPRQMGVEDQGWVAWFVIAASMGRPITIYGDGKQVRDVLYVGDLVRALLMAVEAIDRTKGEIYNIGGGPENALAIWSEFGPLLYRLLGQEVEPAAFRDWRQGDQKVFVSDVRKAQRDFGWRPEVEVEEGIGRLAEWVKTHQDLFAE